jgi:hypothetical protein
MISICIFGIKYWEHKRKKKRGSGGERERERERDFARFEILPLGKCITLIL